MNIDYNALEFWLKASAVTAQGLTFIWLFWINKSKATNASIEDLKQSTASKLEKMGLRMERMEAEAKHAPTHEDLKRIHSRLDQSTGAVEKLEGKIDAMHRTLT